MSVKPLKTNSSRANKAYSSDLSSKDTRNKPKPDLHKESINEDLENARKLASEWELNVDKLYGEEEVITIFNLLNYHGNVDRGFARANDEQLYQSELKKDIDGILFVEAMRGLEFERGWRKIWKEVKALSQPKKEVLLKSI
jgi:hypothetical protein